METTRFEGEGKSLDTLRKKYFDILEGTKALKRFKGCELLEDTEWSYSENRKDFYRLYKNHLGAILDYIEGRKSELWREPNKSQESYIELKILTHAYEDFMTKLLNLKQDNGEKLKVKKQLPPKLKGLPDCKKQAIS